jgi:hypothetical protein
VQRQAFQK